MTQFFIETKTTQPQLFSFTQVLNENFDDISFINSFQDNFEQRQNDCWLKFWNTEGSGLILQAWNDKYKDFLENPNTTKESKIQSSEQQQNPQQYLEEDTTILKEDIQLKSVEDHKKNLLGPEFWNIEGSGLILQADKYKDFLENPNTTKESKIQSSEQQQNPQQYLEEDTTILEEDIQLKSVEDHKKNLLGPEECNIQNDELQSYNWDDLWTEHCQNIKNSLAKTLFNVDEEETEGEIQTEAEHLKLAEELEQLELLGLPTSFGRSKSQPSFKKKNKLSTKNLNFSDFFSDSEFENHTSDSDMEEVSEETVISTEDDVLLPLKVKDNAISKAKRKNRKLKHIPAFLLEEKGMLKYWRKRFSLFSRFDDGIRLDRESWFSVTPEKVARHLAERLKCSILVDGFCGSGGNAIQFAGICDRVIAIDIDPVKLDNAKHNAKIYKVDHKIEFIAGDFLQIALSGKLKADIVFLSPPWGGPKYKNKKDYDIEKYLLPVNASELVRTSRLISENVALFLPRNSNIKQIVRLAGAGNRCEIEHNYLDSRLVAITALYGEDILVKNYTTE